jgi:hypothetical protein
VCVLSFLGINWDFLDSRERAVHSVEKRIQEKIDQKYHLKMIGIGSSQKDHKQTMIGLSFQINQNALGDLGTLAVT